MAASSFRLRPFCYWLARLACCLSASLLVKMAAALEDPDEPREHPLEWTEVLGDIEGRLAQWHHFLTHSQAIDASSTPLRLREGKGLVFLGDASDRGSASLEIITTLSELKQSHPILIGFI